MMLKADLRIQYQQKRETLSKSDLVELCQKIKNRFFQHLPSSVFTIHIYLPIDSKKEINTWPIIHRLWELGLNTLVPVMDSKSISLDSFLLTPDTQLQANHWKVPEPVNSPMIENKVIDLVVLPLLTFDKQGYRVGYGKGFYDRFLALFQQQPLKVGLSLFDPIDKISDISREDIPMDYCITPEKVFTF